MALEGDFPDGGQITVQWTVHVVGGERRLGWKYESVPLLDAQLAIALLRDVAGELEIDLPDSN